MFPSTFERTRKISRATIEETNDHVGQVIPKFGYKNGAPRYALSQEFVTMRMNTDLEKTLAVFCVLMVLANAAPALDPVQERDFDCTAKRGFLGKRQCPGGGGGCKSID